MFKKTILFTILLSFSISTTMASKVISGDLGLIGYDKSGVNIVILGVCQNKRKITVTDREWVIAMGFPVPTKREYSYYKSCGANYTKATINSNGEFSIRVPTIPGIENKKRKNRYGYVVIYTPVSGSYNNKELSMFSTKEIDFEATDSGLIQLESYLKDLQINNLSALGDKEQVRLTLSSGKSFASLLPTLEKVYNYYGRSESPRLQVEVELINKRTNIKLGHEKADFELNRYTADLDSIILNTDAHKMSLLSESDPSILSDPIEYRITLSVLYGRYLKSEQSKYRKTFLVESSSYRNGFPVDTYDIVINDTEFLEVIQK